MGSIFISRARLVPLLLPLLGGADAHLRALFTIQNSGDKKKCISCNVCTSVCHQGIDIMNFANKGLPMEDPQCVRCSAIALQMCPTVFPC